MPYAIRERMHRDFAFLVDLTRRLLLNMLARDFDFDNMGAELRREVRGIGLSSLVLRTASRPAKLAGPIAVRSTPAIRAGCQG
jgi:hypothetical protein